MADERIDKWKIRYADKLKEYNELASRLGVPLETDLSKWLKHGSQWQSAVDTLNMKCMKLKVQKDKPVALLGKETTIEILEDSLKRLRAAYDSLLSKYHATKVQPLMIGGNLTASQGFRWQAVTIG